jgi:hypothetical protein
MNKTAACLLSALVLCLAACAPARSADIKYSVMMLHYNLQYVAGDEVIENKIIEHAFAPMVDFFLEHPSWGADFEMQGYMLEQTAIRYPEVYRKFKQLMDRKQVDLVSFHFSDQLFMAYPRRDMEWSEMLNQKTFKDLGLTRSGTVFTQEGQSGQGMADYMLANGFDTICYPKNLYRYWQKSDTETMPYYDFFGVSAVQCGKGVDWSANGRAVKLNWTFFNDAELLPTGGATPYAEEFGVDPEAMANYEKRLADLEADGYVIGTIGQYVNALKNAGVKPATLKPVLDGDWQPIDTHSLFRWMGDYHFQYERDNEVLAGNVQARHRVLAAETIINHLKKNGRDTAALDTQFMDVIRNLAIAQVSDSTGWTPWPGEIEYSKTHAAAAADGALAIIKQAKTLLKTPFARIDAGTGDVLPLDSAPAPRAEPAPGKCPIDITLQGKIKKQEITCGEAGDHQWEIRVRFKTSEWHSNNFRLMFPRTEDVVTYSPALTDDKIVSYPLASFDPENGDWMYIPAPNGLVGLGGGMFLIKDTRTVNVTFNVPVGEKVVSLDMLKPPNRVFDWRLILVTDGPEHALQVADEMNVHRKDVY